MNDGPSFERAPCALCGARRADVVYDGLADTRYGGPGAFALVRCCDCELVRLDPRPNDSAIGAYYDDRYVPYRDRSARRSGSAAALRRALSAPYRIRHGSLGQAFPVPRTGARVLDVGCGSGELMRQMAGLGWEVWGIEMDRDAAAAAARGIGAERVFVGKALDADYPSGSFDAVTGSHVLEHLHDPLDLLRRVRAWLRPDGELRLWTPNIASVESRLFGARWSGLDVPRHLHHFTPATLGALLGEAGFQALAWRPQFQGSSFADSLAATILAVARRRFSPAAGLLYGAAVPIGWLLCGLGSDAYVEVRARPR